MHDDPQEALLETAAGVRAALKQAADALSETMFCVHGKRQDEALAEADRWLRATEPDFHCHVCGADTDSAPNWPERAVCPAHCPDHMYEYERGEQTHRCRTCGQQAPDDWYEVD